MNFTMFIPPIADIIRGFLLPDYRGMFDAVMRDLNWVAGHETILKLLDVGVAFVDLSMIRVCPFDEYDRVLGQIDGAMGYFRFWAQGAEYKRGRVGYFFRGRDFLV